ncbi:PEP-CTERM/exosortase system-associated acyltransferase [Halieaceae bacterium IMCC14734]|uniref:PEP-CTERM/exosortase system-associated acyltransferase n=1 Tax=Candidatus Litorirhabdus singularis TaxID=2518993 RepID=A0ABT3TGX9_9GAMM|nr:PEP-CTERM/exosortase system-associated acyltransferase [Candidatus Litorirhabdus singularis]MCX2981259.1 PEP-CTERM/exosortase system-associated acyltransferase [Candidatus Litorirhabdus singularis]
MAERFLDIFDVSLVHSAMQIEQAQRIRFRVYCEEKGYEPAIHFPDGLERDKFDSHSSHCLVTHRETGLAAACIRLVFADDDLGIPFEEHCAKSVFTEFAGIINDEREQVGEFSRIAVDPTFRGYGVAEFASSGEGFSAQDRATFPLISVAVLVSAFALAELNGRPHIFAMMEQSLARMMARAGVLIEAAGVEVDYHGRRRLHYASTANVVANLQPACRELYGVIYAEFAERVSKDAQRQA